MITPDPKAFVPNSSHRTTQGPTWKLAKEPAVVSLNCDGTIKGTAADGGARILRASSIVFGVFEFTSELPELLRFGIATSQTINEISEAVVVDASWSLLDAVLAVEPTSAVWRLPTDRRIFSSECPLMQSYWGLIGGSNALPRAEIHDPSPEKMSVEQWIICMKMRGETGGISSRKLQRNRIFEAYVSAGKIKNESTQCLWRGTERVTELMVKTKNRVMTDLRELLGLQWSSSKEKGQRRRIKGGGGWRIRTHCKPDRTGRKCKVRSRGMGSQRSASFPANQSFKAHDIFHDDAYYSPWESD